MPELWEFTQQNPWWDDSKSIEKDIKIASFEASSVKWLPEAYHEINFDSPCIYVVKGVRQVGKSTLFKLLIRKLINEDAPPRSIFFFSFDNLADFRQIPELIKKYFDLTEPFKFNQHYLFFDEVTLIKNWQQGIKYAADVGLLKDSVVILSGSSAVELKYSSERLPGRRGGGSDLNKLLLPINFHEFLKLKGLDTDRINLDEILEGNLRQLEQFKIDLPAIQKNLLEYVTVGGIPAVLDNYLKTSLPTNPKLTDIYSDVFFSTMGKLNRSRTTLLQIIRRLVQLNFSRFSWQSFTSEIDIGSFHTTLDYLEQMADSYFIGIVYFFDRVKKTIRPKKEKKVYVTDPIFFKLFLALSGVDFDIYLTKSDLFGLYVENIVYAHLLRLFKMQAFEGLANLQNIFYWYSEKQKEVDFIIYDDRKLMPIEIKHQRRITPSDYLGMKKVFNKGLVLTRDVFFQDGNICGVPLPIFLACLP